MSEEHAHLPRVSKEVQERERANMNLNIFINNF